jgi:hypothetical protein
LPNSLPSKIASQSPEQQDAQLSTETPAPPHSNNETIAPEQQKQASEIELSKTIETPPDKIAKSKEMEVNAVAVENPAEPVLKEEEEEGLSNQETKALPENNSGEESANKSVSS